MAAVWLLLGRKIPLEIAGLSMYLSYSLLNPTFNVIFLIIVAVLNQICIKLKMVVYLSKKRNTIFRFYFDNMMAIICQCGYMIAIIA